MTYWNGNGTHQDEYTRLYETLVPDMGAADTRHGEILRCAANVYYDIYNNGGWNLSTSKKDQVETLVGWRHANSEPAKLAKSKLARLLRECEYTMPSYGYGHSYDDDEDDCGDDYDENPFDGLYRDTEFLKNLEHLIDEIIVWVAEQCKL